MFITNSKHRILKDTWTTEKMYFTYLNHIVKLISEALKTLWVIVNKYKIRKYITCQMDNPSDFLLAPKYLMPIPSTNGISA